MAHTTSENTDCTSMTNYLIEVGKGSRSNLYEKRVYKTSCLLRGVVERAIISQDLFNKHLL